MPSERFENLWPRRRFCSKYLGIRVLSLINNFRIGEDKCLRLGISYTINALGRMLC
jgi:hypothetical protein